MTKNHCLILGILLGAVIYHLYLTNSGKKAPGSR